MLKKFVGGFAALLLCLGVLIAEEVTGKVEKVEKGTITVNGKEFKAGKKAEGLKVGDEVTVTFEKKDDKVKVTDVKAKKK